MSDHRFWSFAELQKMSGFLRISVCGSAWYCWSVAWLSDRTKVNNSTGDVDVFLFCGAEDEGELWELEKVRDELASNGNCARFRS